MYDREDLIQEKAPPGAKYERMVKHIKAKYKKGGLSDKEKSIAYATAWKQYNKEEVEQLDELAPLAIGAGLAAAGAIGYGLHKAGESMRQSRSGQSKAKPGSIESNIQKRRAAEAELMRQSYELEGELVDERTRYAKETGKNVRTGRPSVEGGDPRVKERNKPPLKYGGSRQKPKVRGEKPPAAGKPGSGVQDPAHRVALRRASSEMAKNQKIGSRFDHFELDGNDLQEKYLYTYLYERNYDALDKDMDGDKDFADVMIARMIASGKSREEAIKATMSKEYNKKGKKVKISDEFSDWRDELGESLSKKSPFVDVMPKDGQNGDESESLKAARKRQQPNQKVTEETLEEFADSLGGFLVEAEQLDEFVAVAARALPYLARAVTTAVKSPAARSVIVKGPKGFKPPTPKPVTTPKPPTTPKPSTTPGTKPSTPVPVKPVRTPKPGTQPTPTPKKPAPATEPTPAPTKPQIKPEVEKATKPNVQKVVKTAVGTAAATSAAAVLLQPLVKPQPATETDVATGQKTGAPGAPGGPGGPGGRVRGGGPIPLPRIPKMNYGGTIGYTMNPQ